MLKSFLMCLFIAANPLVRDCSELERLGFTASGTYYLDPTGTRDPTKMGMAYCHQGWTYVLRRQNVGDMKEVNYLS